MIFQINGNLDMRQPNRRLLGLEYLFLLKLLLPVVVLVTLIREAWPRTPPPPLFKTREEVPCLTVWLTNFHVLVSLWGVGQLFGRGCKSDGFFFKKVPKLCRLQMGRFALGQLRHAQHKYKAELIVCYRHTPPHQIMFICRSKWKEQ